jgi:hypothetical protein
VKIEIHNGVFIKLREGGGVCPGLNPTISKNRKKILFSVYTGKFETDKFFL